MVGLPNSGKIEDTYNRLDTIMACDGQTDGQTSCHGIVRAMHTRCAVKYKYFCVNTSVACTNTLSDVIHFNCMRNRTCLVGDSRRTMYSAMQTTTS